MLVLVSVPSMPRSVAANHNPSPTMLCDCDCEPRKAWACLWHGSIDLQEEDEKASHTRCFVKTAVTINSNAAKKKRDVKQADVPTFNM